MNTLHPHLLAAMLASGMATSALATHPLVTDDPSVQGQGNQQIEINTDWIHQQGIHSRIGVLTYTYGWRNNTDLYVNVPAGLAHPSGAGNVTLGAKWRLLEREAGVVALKPEVLLPASTEEKGLGNGRASMMLTLLLSHEAGPWSINSNFGLGSNRYKLAADRAAHRTGFWRVSTSATYHATSALAMVGDIGIARNRDVGTRINPAFVLGGLIYSPNKDVDLDIGIKFGLNRPEVDRQLGTGLTVRF